MSHNLLKNLISHLQKLVEDDPALADQAVLFQYILKEDYMDHIGCGDDEAKTLTDQRWSDMVDDANDAFANDSSRNALWRLDQGYENTIIDEYEALETDEEKVIWMLKADTGDADIITEHLENLREDEDQAAE